MSSQVDVRSIADLKTFKSSLMRFRSEANAELDRAANGINETFAWLDSRRRYWQDQIRRSHREIELAQDALDNCQSYDDDDDDDDYRGRRDCGEHEHALAKAQRRLEEAEHESQVVDQAFRAVTDAAKVYQAQARRLRSQLSSDLAKSTAYLDRQIRELEKYTHISSPTAHVGTSAAFSPPKASSGSSSSGSQSWRDAGMQMVSLSVIDDSDSNIAGGSNKGVSAEQMDEGLKKLFDVVIPAVKEGHGADYLRDLDSSKGLSGPGSYSDIYDIYFVRSPITVNKVGNRYVVEDGYHRIDRSRRQGRQSIPARVFTSEDS